MSQERAVDTILLAMVAMIFTRFSHGRMASRYPAAGPAYTYVGRGLTLTSASWLGRLTYPRRLGRTAHPTAILNPRSFHLGAVTTGTSFAALTYLGSLRWRRMSKIPSILCFGPQFWSAPSPGSSGERWSILARSLGRLYDVYQYREQPGSSFASWTSPTIRRTSSLTP
jgi:hypothetical protein